MSFQKQDVPTKNLNLELSNSYELTLSQWQTHFNFCKNKTACKECHTLHELVKKSHTRMTLLSLPVLSTPQEVMDVANPR